MRYARVIAEIAATPLAVMPEKLAAVMGFLADQARGIKYAPEDIEARIGQRHVERPAVQYHAVAGEPEARIGGVEAARKPGRPRKIKGAVAVIPVLGIIAQRISMMDDISGPGGTSTERVGAELKAALARDDIGAVVLLFDSPGGSVYGVDELGAQIRDAAAGDKPVISQVSSLAASAAYWLAAQGAEVVITPGGEVGSVGVYTVHQDISAAAEAAGVKTTYVFAGDYKVEGNPFEPLGDDARAAMQKRVDEYYESFLSAVAEGRGVSVAEVRDGFGRGRVVGAKEAEKLGMVDRIGTLDDTLMRLGVTAPAGGAKAAVTDSAPIAEEQAPVPDDSPAPTVEPAVARRRRREIDLRPI